MSQYDFGTIDPYTDDGVALADMLNNWRDAVHSWHRGAARPSYGVPGMAWVNDVGGPANWQVMIYMGPTAGDVPWFTYDTTTGKISAPSTLQLGPGGPKLVTIDANTLAAQNDAGALIPINVINQPPGDAGNATASTKFVTDAIALAMASGGSISVGVVPPPSPASNALWWKSDDGLLFIYFNDGNSAQWVPATVPMFLGNTVLQKQYNVIANGTYTGTYSTNTGGPPTTAGGALLATANMTPKSATSRIEVAAVLKGCVSFNLNDCFALALFVGATLIDYQFFFNPPNTGTNQVFTTSFASPGTAPQTITLRIGSNGGNGFAVGNSANGGGFGILQPGMVSRFDLKEIG